MKIMKDGKVLYMYCLLVDIIGVSCEEGEVEVFVFDCYWVEFYKEVSYKLYVIVVMIFLSKVKNL